MAKMSLMRMTRMVLSRIAPKNDDVVMMVTRRRWWRRREKKKKKNSCQFLSQILPEVSLPSSVEL